MLNIPIKKQTQNKTRWARCNVEKIYHCPTVQLSQNVTIIIQSIISTPLPLIVGPSRSTHTFIFFPGGLLSRNQCLRDDGMWLPDTLMPLLNLLPDLHKAIGIGEPAFRSNLIALAKSTEKLTQLSLTITTLITYYDKGIKQVGMGKAFS